MTTEVVKTHAQAPPFTPDQLTLIKKTIAKDATDNELQLFLYRCKNMGLDPLKPGQIHFVKYGQGPGTVVVGIEGFRSIAGRTGKLSGIARGALKDAQGKLIGGWAEVSRKDWAKPAREEVPLSEYNTGRGPWAKMPETMIKKVAEAAALRMAFPDDLGGVYESAEMDQASRGVYPEQPEPGDGAPNPNPIYTVPFGKHKGYGLGEIQLDELRAYVTHVETNKEKLNSRYGISFEDMDDFIARASDHIVAFETGAAVDMGNDAGAEG